MMPHCQMVAIRAALRTSLDLSFPHCSADRHVGGLNVLAFTYASQTGLEVGLKTIVLSIFYEG